MSDGDRTELAAQVAKRRKDMRLPIDLSEHGGPTEMTVRNIEAGTSRAIRAHTKTRLENALEWRPGLVDKILEGTATPAELDEHVKRIYGSDGARGVESAASVQSMNRYGSMFLSIEPDGSETLEVAGTLVGISADVAEVLTKFGLLAAPGDSFTASADGSTVRYRKSGDSVQLSSTKGFARRVDPNWKPRSTVQDAPIPDDPSEWRGPLQQQAVARAAHDVGQALVANLLFCERTPRVEEAVNLVQRALNLLLAEQMLPGGDV